MLPPYTATKRIYRTKEGNVCEENDPASAFLVVGVGGTIPHDEAKRLGLIKEVVSRETPEAARKRALRGGD